MDEATIRVRTGGGSFRSGSLLFALLVEAATVTVDCDAGSTVAGALNSLKPGDTLLVSGTCKEQVTVSAEIQRITLDGQKKSTIQFTGSTETPGSVAHAVYIRGKEITIKGFTVTGGRDGIHLSGPASAVIDGNVIINNAQRGIHIDKGSVAQIINAPSRITMAQGSTSPRTPMRESGSLSPQIRRSPPTRSGTMVDMALTSNVLQARGSWATRSATTRGAELPSIGVLRPIS